MYKTGGGGTAASSRARSSSPQIFAERRVILGARAVGTGVVISARGVFLVGVARALQGIAGSCAGAFVLWRGETGIFEVQVPADL